MDANAVWIPGTWCVTCSVCININRMELKITIAILNHALRASGIIRKRLVSILWRRSMNQRAVEVVEDGWVQRFLWLNRPIIFGICRCKTGFCERLETQFFSLFISFRPLFNKRIITTVSIIAIIMAEIFTERNLRGSLFSCPIQQLTLDPKTILINFTTLKKKKFQATFYYRNLRFLSSYLKSLKRSQASRADFHKNNLSELVKALPILL